MDIDAIGKTVRELQTRVARLEAIVGSVDERARGQAQRAALANPDVDEVERFRLAIANRYAEDPDAAEAELRNKERQADAARVAADTLSAQAEEGRRAREDRIRRAEEASRGPSLAAAASGPIGGAPADARDWTPNASWTEPGQPHPARQEPQDAQGLIPTPPVDPETESPPGPSPGQGGASGEDEDGKPTRGRKKKD